MPATKKRSSSKGRKPASKKAGRKPASKKTTKRPTKKTARKSGGKDKYSEMTVAQLRQKIAKHNKTAKPEKKIKTTVKKDGEHVAKKKASLVTAAKKHHL